ncbi:MAG: hypothetical protein ACYDEQ_03215 [Desulfocucumaceae bacterium]
MTIKLSLQEAQDLYQKSNTTRREKEPQGRHAKGEGHTPGPVSGPVGEKVVRECLGVLNDALGMTGDVK